MGPSHNRQSSGWEEREPALYRERIFNFSAKHIYIHIYIYGLVSSNLNYKLSATIKMANELLQTLEAEVIRASCFQSNRGVYSLSKICIRAKMYI